MKKEDLQTRLDILYEQKVINQEVYNLTLQAFEALSSFLQKEDIKNSEMLFTHLPMGLMRILRGNDEEIEAPEETVLLEIKKHDSYDQALQLIKGLEELFSKPLPKAEIDYLLIHYINIIFIHKGEN